MQATLFKDALIITELPSKVNSPIPVLGVRFSILLDSGPSLRIPATILLTSGVVDNNRIEADCSMEEALIEQEGQYTTLLGWAINYRLQEGRLGILTARALIFIPEVRDLGLMD